MIELVGLFPNHLNLNGDFGNLQVLEKQLAWRGMEHKVRSAESVTELGTLPTFVLIGHGSEAAWSDIESDFISMIPRLRDLVDSGVLVMAVSTGFEMSVRHGLVAGLSLGPVAERVSKFEVATDQTGQVLGYVNTDTTLPVIYREGSFVGTNLHGPVLAKNTELLESLIANLALRAEAKLNPIQNAEKADLLVGLIDEVWKLEEELANE